MAHAYFLEGSPDDGVREALTFAEGSLGLSSNDPDLIVLRHTLFSVDDARRLQDIAVASAIGERRVLIVSLTRFFHEAQNALLKLFEEPPPGVTLLLVLPSAGMLLPTLRSRLSPLSESQAGSAFSMLGREFLGASDEERQKLIDKLVDQSKADKDETKQAARSEAVRLAEDLLKASEAGRKVGEGSNEYLRFSRDLMHFLPLLHTRSAPLKLIFEHLLLVIPKGLGKGVV